MVRTYGRAQTTQVFTAEDITTAATSVELNCQRLGDESGQVQIELNQDPGGGAGGTFQIQGRLSADASWVTLQAVTIASFQGNNSQIFEDITICPEMRISVDSPSSVAASTTADAWIAE